MHPNAWRLVSRPVPGALEFMFVDELYTKLVMPKIVFLNETRWNDYLGSLGMSFQQVEQSGIRVFGTTAGLFIGLLKPMP